MGENAVNCDAKVAVCFNDVGTDPIYWCGEIILRISSLGRGRHHRTGVSAKIDRNAIDDVERFERLHLHKPFFLRVLQKRVGPKIAVDT